MRILIIEDDVEFSRHVSLLITSAGAVTDQVETGEEGLDLVRHYDYDLVILDLMLPDIEGYQVVRRMRAAHVETPILIVSAL